MQFCVLLNKKELSVIMTFSILSVAVIFILAFALTAGALKGARKGLEKTVISLVTLAVSLIISVIVSPHLAQFFSVELLNIVKTMPFYGTVLPRSAYIDLAISAIASMLVSSVLFLAVLAVLNAWFGSLLNMLYKRMKKESKQTTYGKPSSSWGAAAGALSGLIVAVTVLSPVIGTIRMAKSIIDTIDKADRTVFAAEEVKKDIDAFRFYANDGALMVLYNMGGSLIYSSAANTNVNGETIYAVNEMKSISVLVDDFLAIYPILLNPADITDDHAEAMENLCVHLNDSKMFDILLAEFLPQTAGAWLRGEMYMKIPKPAVNELIAPAFDGILEICETSKTYKNVNIIKISAAEQYTNIRSTI